ncbi:hypothetical protein BJ878DRAFT_579455 [Calycina marina]|uniref:AMP-dependent synthetase/ligase domain-containing protein n=1 Tax=Calycina marina TaxID=1763456 RepID=A0A9P8CC57_9HELO|nr:hypothetical protein BJ878DRAFT_579455 [Calycina marina]
MRLDPKWPEPAEVTPKRQTNCGHAKLNNQSPFFFQEPLLAVLASTRRRQRSTRAIDYPETTVVDLFDAWATSTPEATAVEWNGQRLTYAGLRDASLHVGKSLLSVDVASGDKIPILAQMSLKLLPAIWGVLRAGACYVPIDITAWSRARIDSTIEDISPQVAIATSQPDTPPRCVPVILDTIRRSLDTKALVYVTFTSGTTGKPKGVMIYHRALYRFAAVTAGDALNTAPGEPCAATIRTTITRGGALVMASWSTFPEIATTCDTLILTPSMFATLDPAGPYDKVRSVYLGAEAANFDIALQWITPTRKVIHTYGPSEATILISYGRVPDDTEPDLGVLNPGVEVVLVDENLQESDNIGEILIGGPCLAAGYLNNPELTAKKSIDWNGKRVYRTGRADRMVKNRGFLINLETEVESAMLRFTDVRVVSAFMWRGKLMEFVQPATVNLKELRVFMKENFDLFVVPDEIVALDQLPLTVNGKVDRAALNARLEDRMAKEDADLDTMFLRQQGYAITIMHIFRGDTIDHLGEKLTKINGQNGASDPNAKFVGEQDSVATPTPSELQVAWTATLAAHSVFKTRYDMRSWTLRDLDRVNLDWEEVIVEAEDFDNSLLAVQEQAIGFVWGIHHVLIDILSFIILMRDLEQALAKEKRMMKPLCERSLLAFRLPQTPFQGNAWRSLPFTTRETLESIEASVRTYNVSSATLIFAAWALVLAKFTRSSFASFYLSRSGRMVPWAQAPSLVAAMNCRVPFATEVLVEVTVHEWLAEMHSTLLRVAELENLCQSPDANIYPEEYFKTGVQAFLYMAQLPTSWEIHDMLTGQAGQVGMVWRVQTAGNGAVEAELENDQTVVDVEWAREVGTVATIPMSKGGGSGKEKSKVRTTDSARARALAGNISVGQITIILILLLLGNLQ